MNVLYECDYKCMKLKKSDSNHQTFKTFINCSEVSFYISLLPTAVFLECGMGAVDVNGHSKFMLVFVCITTCSLRYLYHLVLQFSMTSEPGSS